MISNEVPSTPNQFEDSNKDSTKMNDDLLAHSWRREPLRVHIIPASFTCILCTVYLYRIKRKYVLHHTCNPRTLGSDCILFSLAKELPKQLASREYLLLRIEHDHWIADLCRWMISSVILKPINFYVLKHLYRGNLRSWRESRWNPNYNCLD